MNVQDPDFDQVVLRSERPVMVDFWATWCAPCRAVAPVVERMARQLAGTVDVVKVDVDQAPGVAQRYGIRSIPTLSVFVDGQQAASVQGAVPEPQLWAMVEKAVPALALPRLTPAQLEKRAAAGELVVADVRPATDYDRHHIPGAISAPATADAPESWAPPAIPEGKLLVLVDKNGVLSVTLARRVGREMPGKIGVLEGGVLEWEISGRALT